MSEKIEPCLYPDCAAAGLEMVECFDDERYGGGCKFFVQCSGCLSQGPHVGSTREAIRSHNERARQIRALVEAARDFLVVTLHGGVGKNRDDALTDLDAALAPFLKEPAS